jgi:trans-aconitate 2-methyltransferase
MWSPSQYGRFRQERRQPFDDLMALLVPRPLMRIADLGCGPGELTREMHVGFAARETIGVDDSPAMIAKASALATGTLRFEQQMIQEFDSNEPFDLIFSNAALHWVGGHEELFARLTRLLSDQGQLAIQMPANDTHASHRIAAHVARHFGLEPRPSPILAIEQYASLLHRLGFPSPHVRMQVYTHLLDSSADVVEWVRGALLTHYESQLDAGAFSDFLTRYRGALLGEIGDRAPYLYTYRRILMHAMRPGTANE